MLLYAFKQSYNLPKDGVFPIETEMLYDELQVHYDELIDQVGKLTMEVKDGNIVKAYRARFGLKDGEPMIVNGDNMVPVSPGIVKVCRSFYYVNVSREILATYGDEEIFEVDTNDLLELGAVGSNLVKVQAKKVPDGIYTIKSKRVVPYQDREFLAVTLVTPEGEPLKVVGEQWNSETQENDIGKYVVTEFDTTLNARYKREACKAIRFQGGQAF